MLSCESRKHSWPDRRKPTLNDGRVWLDISQSPQESWSMIPNETHGTWQPQSRTHAPGRSRDAMRRAHVRERPSAATSRHGWVGLGVDWHIRGLWELVQHPLCPTSTPACRTDAQRGEGEHCTLGGLLGWIKAAVGGEGGEIEHIWNATYIWYSSIASTNCPHESKSVPFLKLACHFWTVLLTSAMLAGRILAALSGQHSRASDSSTGLQLWRRRWFGQHGYLGSGLAQWHTDQALSACSP